MTLVVNVLLIHRTWRDICLFIQKISLILVTLVVNVLLIHRTWRDIFLFIQKISLILVTLVVNVLLIHRTWRDIFLFIQKISLILVTLILIHKEDKPYTCDTCSQYFSRLSGLKTHMHNHFWDNPFIVIVTLEVTVLFLNKQAWRCICLFKQVLCHILANLIVNVFRVLWK